MLFGAQTGTDKKELYIFSGELADQLDGYRQDLMRGQRSRAAIRNRLCLASFSPSENGKVQIGG
jgi:hypothetical protein